MSAFGNMKRNKTSNLSKIRETMEKEAKGKKYDDDRYWKPTTDKAGNSFAIIRFLPEAEGSEKPYVKIYDHGFKEGGQWYIEKCATTLDQPCYICEENRKLWSTGLKSDEAIARQRGRRESYHANILVISDPANPDSEGKVFIYRFGKKIFKKIMEKIAPEFKDEEPFNPFCFWSGANFKLKVKLEGGFPNYDSSEFAAQSELFGGDDEQLEKLWKQQHNLDELRDPSHFISYQDSVSKFKGMMNSTNPERDETGDIKFGNSASKRFSKTEETEGWDEPKKDTKKESTHSDQDIEDDMSIYAKLLE